MKKLIAIDMDGTLISSNLDISAENIQAIHKAQQAGHIVMMCSGRAPEDIMTFIEQKSLRCPVAGSNGTVVIADGQVLSQISMNQEAVKKIAAVLDQQQVPYMLYTNQGTHAISSWKQWMEASIERHPEIAEKFTPLERKMIAHHASELTGKSFDHIDALLAKEELLVQKFFMIILSGQEELTAELELIPDLSITSSFPLNIEIMDIHGHKGTGVKVMAEYYNIPMENTVAIGDNYNDVPMFEAAGFSIAMGNADEQVQNLADAVTLTNNEHGVAHAIEKYVLAT